MTTKSNENKLQKLYELLEQEPKAAFEVLADESSEIQQLFEELHGIREVAVSLETPQIPSGQTERIKTKLHAMLEARSSARPKARKIIPLETLVENEKSFKTTRRSPTMKIIETHDDGSPRMELEELGPDHVVMHWYHPNGTKASSVPWKDSKRHGKETRWYPDGTMEEIRHYVNGELHGEFKVYSSDGTLSAEGVYADGECTESKTLLDDTDLEKAAGGKGPRLRKAPIHIFGGKGKEDGNDGSVMAYAAGNDCT